MSQTVKTVLQQEIRCAFHLFDRTGESVIDANDFGTVIRSLGHEMKQQTALDIAETLIDEDGVIKYEKFRSYYYAKLNSKQMRDEFRQAFNVMDVDKDGVISFNDLKTFLEAAGQSKSNEQISEMIKDADIDGDQCISFEEFARLLATR